LKEENNCQIYHTVDSLFIYLNHIKLLRFVTDKNEMICFASDKQLKKYWLVVCGGTLMVHLELVLNVFSNCNLAISFNNKLCERIQTSDPDVFV
jgi:hypothetical protein